MSPQALPTKRAPGRGKNRVTAAQKRKMAELRVYHGLSFPEIAERMGVSDKTVRRHVGQDRALQWLPAGEDRTDPEDVSPPKLWEQLEDDVKARVDDFASFRWYYFKRETPAFQVQTAERVEELGPNEGEIVLWPPGAGKTTFWTHDLPIWLLIRARVRRERFACLLASATLTMAEAFLRRIARSLEHNKRLLEDFGSFRPEFDVWRKDALVVAGFDPDTQGKEPNFIAAGADSQIYGWRVDLIIPDDLVTKKTAHSMTMTDKMEDWFAEELMSRMEHGARIAVPGTRFATLDLYGRLLRKVDEDGEPLFRRTIFPLHDETKCSGTNCSCRTPCEHHPSYPDGCLLWPERWSMWRVKRVRATMRTSERFEFVYQQKEVVEADALVTPESWELCQDQGRRAWQVPAGSKVMCTLDPSPTEWAVFQAWAYRIDLDRYQDTLDGAMPVAPSRYAVAMERRHGMSVQEYLMVIRDWTSKLRALNFDPTWVIEINAAQRWLSQMADFQRLKTELGLNVQVHTTGANKADPEFGVRVLRDSYAGRKVSIPAADSTSKQMFSQLGAELMAYPHGESDDCVMANWFFENRLDRARMGHQAAPHLDVGAPPWMNKRRKLIDLRTQRITEVG